MKSPISRKQDPRTGIGWAPWLLVVVGVVTYSNNLDGPLVFDDLKAIEGNESIRHLWPPQDVLFATSGPTKGRPVVNLSLAVNYAIGGLNVRGYHVFNIMVHVLCSLVLFGIIRRTLLSERLRDRFGDVSRGLALACTLIWMVHPLQTECVNYLTQRSESIMGLFYLLTLYGAIRAGEGHRRRGWGIASVLSCALGMASKEVMVTAPVMVLLYDCVFTFGSVKEALRRRWGLYAGLASTWTILAALRVAFPQPGSQGFHLGVSPLHYAMHQCIMIVNYLRLTFWPHPLVFDYGEVRSLPLAELPPYLGILVLVLLATVVVFVCRPMVGFLGAWLFIILAPTSTLVPIITEVGAERRMYLSLAGLVVLAVMGVYVLLERAARSLGTSSMVRGPRRWVGIPLVVVLVVLLVGTTLRRNAEYRSHLSIWQSAVNAVPYNARARYDLGLALEYLSRFDEAVPHFRLALRIQPDYPEAHSNLGVALGLQGKLDEAIAHFRSALQLQPDYAEAHSNLGLALNSQGKLDEAIDHYRRALEIKPGYAEAHNNLGMALKMTGRLDEAIDHYRQAIQIKPEYLSPLQSLAWILATRPDANVQDPNEAIRLAERGCRLTQYTDPAMLDTLAAAYAAAGRFVESVPTAEKALHGATTARNADLASRIGSRLELYRQAKPYQEIGPPQQLR